MWENAIEAGLLEAARVSCFLCAAIALVAAVVVAIVLLIAAGKKWGPAVSCVQCPARPSAHQVLAGTSHRAVEPFTVRIDARARASRTRQHKGIGPAR